MDFIAQHSSVIFGILLVIIALSVIGMFVFVACQTPKNDDNQPVITYNQNGYHSNVSGYQTGKFTKNNTYNGR